MTVMVQVAMVCLEEEKIQVAMVCLEEEENLVAMVCQWSEPMLWLVERSLMVQLSNILASINFLSSYPQYNQCRTS